MTLNPVPIERFGGLDLRAGANQNAAIDMLNVDVGPDGGLRTRSATSVFCPAGGGQRPTIAQYQRTDLPGGQLMVANGLTWRVIGDTGTELASVDVTAPSQNLQRFVQFGTPSATVMYGFGDLDGVVRKWDGASFSTVPAMVGNFGTITPGDNRLAMVNPSGLSKLLFSDAGNPENFPVNNFVQLTPGDGENIVALATWQDKVFAFKNSKFFEFYGNSIDGAGNPVFNYRAHFGIGSALPTVAVGRDGVYFVAPSGVYRTTGGPPVKVSAALDPIFDGTASAPGLSFKVGLNAGGAITVVEDVLYVALGASGSLGPTKIFALNLQTDIWTSYTVGGEALIFDMCGYRAFGETKPALTAICGNITPIVIAKSADNVVRFTGAQGVDATTGTLTSLYRSAFSDFGIPGEKRIREAIVEGTGTPTFAWSRDWGALNAAEAMTLGVSPAITQDRSRTAVRGRLLSYQLAGTGSWTAKRLTANVASSRQTGVLTA